MARKSGSPRQQSVFKRDYCDFTSKKKTENTRVSYPIYHIDNIVKPVSKGKHPNKIVVGLANKMARIVWALLKNKTVYQG